MIVVALAKITVARWARYDDEQSLLLPARGLVVVSGNNGEGKSMLVEAVSHALWGKSIRDKGKGGWRECKEPSRCAVQLVDGHMVVREYSRGKSALYLTDPHGARSRHATATKGQTELDTLVGDFNTWRNSCVFHAGSATSRFASATDADRKRLIDALMGVDVFDRASQRVRAEVKVADQQLARIRREHEDAQRRVAEAKRGFASAQALGASVGAAEPEPIAPNVDAETFRAQLDQLVAQREAAGAERRVLAESLSTLVAELGKLTERASAAGRRVKALDGKPKCPTCGQDAGPDVAARSRAAAKKAEQQRADVQAQHDQAAAALAMSDQQLAAADTMIHRARVHLAGLESQARQHASAVAAWQARRDAEQGIRDRADAEARKHRRAQVEAEERIDALELELEQALARAANLATADKALGLTGIRATVTGDLLTSIEQLANYWLALIDDRLVIELRPFRELTSGGQRDEICLRLTGAGGDGGAYADASTGQQRRVDLALMLALAEVVGDQAGTHGTGATMFFDEVFGALDPSGCRAAARVLRELARDRCVVVLTHSDTQAEELGADMHVRVEAGRLRIS
jgi:DNA repair exonuclease SbcCD ATPase subunit